MVGHQEGRVFGHWDKISKIPFLLWLLPSNRRKQLVDLKIIQWKVTQTEEDPHESNLDSAAVGASCPTFYCDGTQTAQGQFRFCYSPNLASGCLRLPTPKKALCCYLPMLLKAYGVSLEDRCVHENLLRDIYVFVNIFYVRGRRYL
jgi:hypothetical protein